MTTEREPQTADKYIVRFPDGMRDRLKEEAKSNNRTLNAEIISRLDESLGAQGTEVDIDHAATDAQLKIVQTGLRLASIATQFLKLEVPAVAKTDSFEMLLDSIVTAIKGAPEAQGTIEQKLAAAGDAIDKFLHLHQQLLRMNFPDGTSVDTMSDIAIETVDALDPIAKIDRPAKKPK